MNHTRLLVGLGLACLAATALEAQTRLASERALDAYLERAIETTHIPGLVAMVVDEHEVLYSGAFGQQNVADGIPMQVDSIFRLASMTKPVTSLAVQMLIEQGKLELDDRVSIFLPEFAGREVITDFDPSNGSYATRPALDEVSIRHLLTHTSGLGYTFSNEILSQIADSAPGASVAGLPLLFDPGTRWAYGESTRVLGRLVEEVASQPLDAFLEARILGPLGMTTTGFSVAPADRRHVVTVHRMTDAGLVEAPNPEVVESAVAGDGGLIGTAADYVRFIQLFLAEGLSADGTRLVTAESIRSMGRNQIGEVRVELQRTTNPLVSRDFPVGAGSDSFGLGFQVTAEHDDADRRAPGSLSWAGIFNTEFWIDPATGIGAVLLMQYLPFYDEAAIETLEGFERLVYTGLE